MVSIYIPWEAHEISRGEFDFGEREPSNDFDAFLTLCDERDLKVVARLGPQINGEMTWFGYPKRILEMDELHARSAQDSKVVLTQVPRPIPALSYAADGFFDETALWYDALCPILAKHKHSEGGGLVAAQVDNEMAYFSCVNSYAADFGPPAIRNYHSFLRDKYGTVEALDEVYGRHHEDFDRVDPPRRFEASGKQDIPYYADWVEYRERYLIDGIDRLAGMLRERGLDDIALSHNYPHPLGAATPASGYATPPFNLTALEEKLDFVGFDIYFKKEMYDYIKTTVSYVVGSSRYPYVPELFTGTWPWFLDPGGPEDEEFVAKAALMHGIKGFSRYTFVERDRWLNSPVRRDGSVRQDRFDMFARVNEMAEQHRFVDVRRRTDVLLLANREYDRLEAASVLVSFPGDFLETPTTLPDYPSSVYVSEAKLGFEKPVQLAKTDRFMEYYRGLTDAGYESLLSDTALPPERWEQYETVVLSSFEYMNASLQRDLVGFAESGGLVVLGPRIPHLDERMREDDTLRSALSDGEPLTVDGTEVGSAYPVGRGRIVHLTDLGEPARAFEAASRGFDLARVSKKEPRIEVAVHQDADDAGRMIVFAANPTDEKITADVDLNAGLKSVTDTWKDRPVQTNGTSFSDDLPPTPSTSTNALSSRW